MTTPHEELESYWREVQTLNALNQEHEKSLQHLEDRLDEELEAVEQDINRRVESLNKKVAYLDQNASEILNRAGGLGVPLVESSPSGGAPDFGGARAGLEQLVVLRQELAASERADAEAHMRGARRQWDLLTLAVAIIGATATALSGIHHGVDGAGWIVALATTVVVVAMTASGRGARTAAAALHARPPVGTTRSLSFGKVGCAALLLLLFVIPLLATLISSLFDARGSGAAFLFIVMVIVGGIGTGTILRSLGTTSPARGSAVSIGLRRGSIAGVVGLLVCGVFGHTEGSLFKGDTYAVHHDGRLWALVLGLLIGCASAASTTARRMQR